MYKFFSSILLCTFKIIFSATLLIEKFLWIFLYFFNSLYLDQLTFSYPNTNSKKILFLNKKESSTHIKLRFLNNFFKKEANLDSNTTTIRNSLNSKILRLVIDFQRINWWIHHINSFSLFYYI